MISADACLVAGVQNLRSLISRTESSGIHLQMDSSVKHARTHQMRLAESTGFVKRSRLVITDRLE